jgi:hypothetical protein
MGGLYGAAQHKGPAPQAAGRCHGAANGDKYLPHKKAGKVSSPALFQFRISRPSAALNLHVHLDARALRGRQTDLAQILALGARRLGLDDGVDESVEVGAQRSSENESLPMPPWMMPAFSTRN